MYNSLAWEIGEPSSNSSRVCYISLRAKKTLGKVRIDESFSLELWAEQDRLDLKTLGGNKTTTERNDYLLLEELMSSQSWIERELIF